MGFEHPFVKGVSIKITAPADGSVTYSMAVVQKVTFEILKLLKIPFAATPHRKRKISPIEDDGEFWEITHMVSSDGQRLKILSYLSRAGKISAPVLGVSRDFEEYRQAVHRLIKLNFYRILTNSELHTPTALSSDFACSSSSLRAPVWHALNSDFACGSSSLSALANPHSSLPWGIMHGVRPTKIVHYALARDFSAAEIIKILIEDYDVAREKAELLVNVAERQLPFLSGNEAKKISLYIGVPFCPSRCLYCSFPAYKLPGREVLNRYWQAFLLDLNAAKKAVEKFAFKIENVYIGGGTPTALPADLFGELLQRTREYFIDSETREFTVEAGRPDSLDFTKISLMQRYGVTRLSINPQSMQQTTLDLIGRRHSVRDVETMFHTLRAVGGFSINMDLIVGLPGEGVNEMRRTIEKVIALRPDDITLHALAVKRGSALARAVYHKVKKGQTLDEEILPGAEHAQSLLLSDERTSQMMFDVAKEQIERFGLKPYYLYRQGYQRGELENIGFCREGHECRYNIQIMEEKQTIIGVGPAATTKAVNPSTGIMQASFNPKELDVYIDKIDYYIDKRNDLLIKNISNLECEMWNVE